jgi:hypothetical protein
VIELITDLSDFLNEKVMQDFAMSEEHQQIVDNLTQRVEVAEDKCARLEKNAEEN